MFAIIISMIALVVFIFDYIFCLVYCSYKKRKSAFNVNAAMQKYAKSKKDATVNCQSKHLGGVILSGQGFLNLQIVICGLCF